MSLTNSGANRPECLRMKKCSNILVTVGLILFFASSSLATMVEENAIRKIAKVWLKENANFRRVSQQFPGFQKFSIKSINPIFHDESGNVLSYHVALDPKGYLIVNGQDTLQPVLCYSASSDLDLSDVPENSLRAILTRDFDSYKKALRDYRKGIKQGGKDKEFEKNKGRWSNLLAKAEALESVASLSDSTLEYLENPTVADSPLIGPLLQSTWNQNRHYNYFCPADPAASSYYDGRMPVGCVATAAGQIMNYYNWPPHGIGCHSYSWSSTELSADFNDTYSWGEMLLEYDPWNDESASAVEAVAELLYEIGVSIEMQYSTYGSSSSIFDMNSAFNNHFFYELADYLLRADDVVAFAEALSLEMENNSPVIGGVPGHAVVIDGLDTSMPDGTYFHINYGWGGMNDNWYLLDDIVGDTLEYAFTGNIPVLMPILTSPESPTPDRDGTYSINWNFPSARSNEVNHFMLLEGQYQPETLTDHADNDDFWRLNDPWHITSPGYDGTGSAFSMGILLGDYSLTLLDEVRASDVTTLSFYFKARLWDQTFTVEISDDNGLTWNTHFQITEQNMSYWDEAVIDLSDYAGSTVLVRFRVVYPGGYYYSGGGLWLDEIVLSGTDLLQWQYIADDINPLAASYEISGKNTGEYYYAMQACTLDSCGERSPAILQRVAKTNNAIGQILFLLLKSD